MASLHISHVCHTTCTNLRPDAISSGYTTLIERDNTSISIVEEKVQPARRPSLMDRCEEAYPKDDICLSCPGDEHSQCGEMCHILPHQPRSTDGDVGRGLAHLSRANRSSARRYSRGDCARWVCNRSSCPRRPCLDSSGLWKDAVGRTANYRQGGRWKMTRSL